MGPSLLCILLALALVPSYLVQGGPIEKNRVSPDNRASPVIQQESDESDGAVHVDAEGPLMNWDSNVDMDSIQDEEQEPCDLEDVGQNQGVFLNRTVSGNETLYTWKKNSYLIKGCMFIRVDGSGVARFTQKLFPPPLIEDLSRQYYYLDIFATIFNITCWFVVVCYAIFEIMEMVKD